MMTLLVLLIIGLGIPAVMVLGRVLEMRSWSAHLEAYELRFPAHLSVIAVQQWLANVAAMNQASKWSLLPLPPIGLEVTATNRGIRYHLLVHAPDSEKMLAGLRAALPGVRAQQDADYLSQRPAFRVAAELALTSHVRPLGTTRAEGTSAALLASLQPLGRDETVSVQWLFTSAGTPAPVPTLSPKRGNERWSELPVDNSAPADTEAVQALRLKQRSPLLMATARLAVAAPSRARAHQ